MDEFVSNYDQVFVVEMNRDGQLNQLLLWAYPEHAMTLKSVAFGDGMPASAKWIREGILSKYVEPASAKSVKKATRKTAVKKIVAKKVVARKRTAKKTKAAKSGKKGAK